MQKSLHFPDFSPCSEGETTRKTCQKRYNSYPKHAHICVQAHSRTIIYFVSQVLDLLDFGKAMETLSLAKGTRKSLNEMDEPRKARKNTELNCPLREEGQESPNGTNADE